MTQAPPATPLMSSYFPAGEHGFSRAPLLISGATEAVVIDDGLTHSDGRVVADASQGDGQAPDAQPERP